MDRETYVTLSKSINYGDLIYHRKYFSCGLNGRVGWTVYQEDTIIFSILRNIEHFYTHIYSTATNNRYVIKFMSQNVNSFCVHYFQLLLCLWDMRLGCGCIYFFIIRTRRQDILLVSFFQIHLGESKFNLDRSLSF